MPDASQIQIPVRKTRSLGILKPVREQVPMSALGHSRPSHFVPVLNTVRYASDSNHSRYESELTLWAKSRPSAMQQSCCYSIPSSATNGGLPLNVADVWSLQSDLRSPDWYTGNSN